jgi:hypothetical protein
MEGTARPAASALAEYVRAHPEMDEPCCTDGIWHAWLPSERGGEEYHGRTEAELLAKLPR